MCYELWEKVPVAVVFGTVAFCELNLFLAQYASLTTACYDFVQN